MSVVNSTSSDEWFFFVYVFLYQYILNSMNNESYKCSYILNTTVIPCHFLMLLPASHILLLLILIFTAGSHGVDINKIKGKIIRKDQGRNTNA